MAASYKPLTQVGEGRVEREPSATKFRSFRLRSQVSSVGEIPAQAQEGNRNTRKTHAGRQIIERDPAVRCSQTERMNSMMSGAKAISSLMKMELEGYCGLEQESVYGAAVALPQIARSAGFDKKLLGLVFRVYVFLALNIFLQSFLICVINEEALIMNSFGGKMHLCDFGATVENCPGSPGCRGPGGTEITTPRLYAFKLWSTRTFFRDSLEQLFPDRAQEIHEKVDTGEYGIENWWCRLVCLFLFMMGVVDDLCASVDLAVLIIFVPSEDGLWLSYETPDWADKDYAKAVKDLGELDFIRFHIAGMPTFWKVLNVVLVLVPKFLLWYSVTAAGFRFLMETQAIMDLIVNSMALTFILDIDELIIDRFATVATKHIMASLEAFPLFDAEVEDAETPEQAFRRLNKKELAPWTKKDIRLYWLFVPKKLTLTIALMGIFLYKYYYTYCYKEEDGTWVSKDMYLPKGVYWDPLSLLFTALESETEPFWTMPHTGLSED